MLLISENEILAVAFLDFFYLPVLTADEFLTTAFKCRLLSHLLQQQCALYVISCVALLVN
jgi:hypothetical protein